MLTTETVHRIRASAGAYAPLQLHLLRDLSAIDSGTGNLEGNKAVVECIVAKMAALGAAVEQIAVPEVGIHLIARLTPAAPKRRIILSAHLDTVFPPGDAAKHPFRAEGDYAYGLGIADCKGGVAVSMFAVRIARDLGLLPPDLEVVMLFNCDEETGSQTSRALFERESRTADYAFVFEAGRGRNGIITSRRGCAFGSIVVSGKEAHAGLNYPQGADANLELARAVVRLCGSDVPEKGIFFNAGSVRGGKHADTVSNSASADFFVSFASDKDLQLVRDAVANLHNTVSVPGCSLTSSIEVSFPPMERNAAHIRAYRLVKQAGDLLDLELPEESSAGSSDACWYASFGVPTVDALGPYMHDIHTVNECLRISSIRERTELFATTLALLA